MAQVSETTLRIEILRDARTRYADCRTYSETERMLSALMLAECEAMLRELMQPNKE